MRKKIQYGTLVAAAFLYLSTTAGAQAAPAQLASAIVQTSGIADSASFDGVVEAVRQTVIASQVQGAITALQVKAGDTVKAGQVLLRIDARAASQNSAASRAQVQAARAALDVATREYHRQKQLLEKEYISQAAFERAEAQFRATSAELNAQIAQAGATDIQSGFFVVKAPYSGVVSEVPAALGDMAMPGRPLLTMYDPSALRVAAAVPQTALAGFGAQTHAKIELPALPAERQWLDRPQLQVLPTFDAGTHSGLVRVDLPEGIKGITPGMFARIWLPAAGQAATRLYVPITAVVRRAEMTGLYVIGADGKPILRQVRLGRARNDVVEVLTGVTAGERVSLDPQAAMAR
ncbi:MAG TPA: efflux RND transporter periplasmic adaptor subunit [Burkholderiaceae bacterium]|nr:efflux RND transporter periplasmic adaptor subunit [Burkholderiaceae bacterium]